MWKLECRRIFRLLLNMKQHSVKTHFPSWILARIKTSRQALNVALRDWDLHMPGDAMRCPVLRLWWKQEYPIPVDSSVNVGYGNYAYPGRLLEITAAFINKTEFHLPGRRRPTLSEYDNRRDGIVRDRYYYGIYAGKYDS